MTCEINLSTVFGRFIASFTWMRATHKRTCDFAPPPSPTKRLNKIVVIWPVSINIAETISLIHTLWSVSFHPSIPMFHVPRPRPMCANDTFCWTSFFSTTLSPLVNHTRGITFSFLSQQERERGKKEKEICENVCVSLAEPKTDCELLFICLPNIMKI